MLLYEGDSAISEESAAILVSPKFINTETSCVHFQLGFSEMLGFKIQLDNVTTVTTLDKKSVDNFVQFHTNLKYTIPAGTFSVLIHIWKATFDSNFREFNNKIIAYIDDVSLTAGACDSVPNRKYLVLYRNIFTNQLFCVCFCSIPQKLTCSFKAVFNHFYWL